MKNMIIGKFVSPVYALLAVGLVHPGAGPWRAPRPAQERHPILSEHLPSPFKMPKPAEAGTGVHRAPLR